MTTLAKIMPAFLASREARNLRSVTLAGWRIWARHKLQQWGKRKVADIIAADVVGLVSSKSRNDAMMMQCCLRWCITAGHLPRSHDVGTLPLPPRSDEAIICHLSPDDTRRFLEAVKPALRPAFILALYAGLRPYECARIRWESIHLKDRRIRVEARVSKIRRARIIEGIPPIIWRLLKPYARQHGRVAGETATTDDRAVYRLLHERQRAAAEAEVQMGHDILRHTFATYYVALTGHPAMASKVLGHYKLQTLAAHYDGVATKDYFSNAVLEVLT